MNELAECPICFIRIPPIGNSPANLSLHMSTHSKEEVVAALLGRTNTSLGFNVGSIPGIPQGINLSPSINTFISGVSTRII